MVSQIITKVKITIVFFNWTCFWNKFTGCVILYKIPPFSLMCIIIPLPNDTDKVIYYIKLCDWNNYSDSKQAIVYAQSAIAIAKRQVAIQVLLKVMNGLEMLIFSWVTIGQGQTFWRGFGCVLNELAFQTKIYESIFLYIVAF